MESQILHQLASSVALLGEGLEKGQRLFLPRCQTLQFLPVYPIGAFQAATLVLELRGSESEWVSLCMGSLKGTA